MIKTNMVFAFPGAGIEIKGFEKLFFSRHREIMMPFLAEASEFIKTDLVNCLETDNQKLLDDRINQFFVYSFSTGAAAVFSKELSPGVTAGYSFGAYAALCVSGAVDFSSGLKIVEGAYNCMMEICREINSGMCAVIGLSEDTIDMIIKDNNLSDLCIVNSNSDTCKIIAGSKKEITIFYKYAEKHDVLNTITLNVDFPYHHPSLKNRIPESFKYFLRELPWRNGNIPFISSINQKPIIKKEDLSAFVIEQLYTPINWEKVINSLKDMDIKVLIECGPGISLTQNGRFIDNKPAYVNLKNSKRKLNI